VTTPNQDRIFLPPIQKREVFLRADFRYGPDDPTLWPQPWIQVYCHLPAIPRRPEDPNDPLALMWWDPTRDDFETYDAGLVDGLGELARDKFLLLQAMMMSLESRIDSYQEIPPKTRPSFVAGKSNAGRVSTTRLVEDYVFRDEVRPYRIPALLPRNSQFLGLHGNL